MSPPVKVLYLNVTQRTEPELAVFIEMAPRYKLPGIEVHIGLISAADGHFSNAEYRTYEALIARGVVRATHAAAQEGFDALAIGCFYDVALHDAREISGEMVVTASCEIAATLANRFGITVGRRKWANQMQAIVHSYGHGDRLTGFYPADLGVTDFQKDHAETSRRLIAAGRKAVEQDHAEALILGCTMEIGFCREVEKALGVPVIDAVIAVLKRTEYAALLKRQCGCIPSRKWSCEAPPEEEIAQFSCFPNGEVIGLRAVVRADAPPHVASSQGVAAE